MHLPVATYRIQLNKDFTLEQLRRIIPYLKSLGITTVYAAPILQAARGSMHGYDVTDPHRVNEEIGTEEILKDVVELLKRNNMGWLQDIVPNHMAFDVTNERLMDVFERGPASPYYNYFDIDWNHPSPILHGKIMAPFLGKELQTALDDGEIKLTFSDKGFTIDYFDTSYPLSLRSYDVLVASDVSKNWREEINQFLQNAKDVTSLSEWRRAKKDFTASLRDKIGVIERDIADINSDKALLKSLLDKSYYALCFWKTTSSEINYRRFFTVSSLICLRMEDDEVFKDYHAYLQQLRQSGVVQGFRIDHIDGLYDPTAYIKMLRSLVGIDTYVIAEKILEEREGIPSHWEIEGTSGYEFLAYVSQLLTDRVGARKILGYYKTLVPGLPTYKELVLQNKKLILKEHMAGEWDNLSRCFANLGLRKSYTEHKMKDAIGLMMLSMPVYRIYPDSLPLEGEDLKVLQTAFVNVKSLESDCQEELHYLESLFTEVLADKTISSAALKFLRRLMQFTGPLTAKGVEDTTFYVYNPLISHDEVGDSPSRLGISVPEFHRKMIERQKLVPLALNTTSTHDTKRGEDARIRLNILSELPDEWIANVERWMQINQKAMTIIDGKPAPDPNEVYFIHQSLIGGFPEDFQVTKEFVERIQAYLTKVIREAKVNSNWESPVEDYEKACLDFVSAILGDKEFLGSFVPFMKKVVRYAGPYALGQTLIKITAPGIPDIYQGTELLDLSFVDPDNRRAVAYDVRTSLLKKMEQSINLHELEEQHPGMAKLFVTWKALNFRKDHSDVFIQGEYLPLEVTGDNPSALAFARKHKERWILVVVPIGLAAVDHDDVSDKLVLPHHAPSTFTNAFTGETISLSKPFPLKDIFRKFPVALFYNP